MRKIAFFTLFFVSILTFTGCQQQGNSADTSSIRVGYFPNLTHSQALVGLADGTFQRSVGQNITIEPKVFNAGPEEIEALFAGQIDIGYVGPSPAINGYIKSDGEALKIISGATSNGVALVVQPDLAAAFEKEGPKALEGKKIASPQQGNTQDVSLRTYLQKNGLTDTTEVVPMANADQLTLFSQKELDGSWAPEPWASRLIQEAGAQLIIDESTLWPNAQFATTNVIVRTEFLEQHPDLVRAWVKAHVEVTDWINAHPSEAQQTVNTEIEKITTKKLSDAVLQEAWGRMKVSVDPVKQSVFTFSDHAYAQGFLGETKPDISGLYDLSILNEITATEY